nr:G protein-activated inward rectifier potassium channel 1-like [Leptinotarsa decemlineata]
MPGRLENNSVLNECTKVTLDEFCEKSDELHRKRSYPVLVLKKPRISKSRPILRRYFNLSRIVSKSGKLNTFLTKRQQKNLTYIKDLGNTLLTIQWRWILFTLVLVNYASFLLFGGLWWILAINSGDFDENNTTPCVVNTRSFTGYVLLSVETITTIGYGYRYPTEYCEGGTMLFILQSLVSVAIQGALISTVYIKISKPFSSSTSSIFSRAAVICMRDDKLRFIFRIHDFNRKISCGTNISLYFIDKEQVPNTEFEMIQMKIEPHGLCIFPLEIEHIIDETSPLWTFRPLDFLQSRFEIIAVAEGSSYITGLVSQNRTSYSSSDILWGHRFKQCVEYDETKMSFVVDYENFKKTIPFNTPLCSAKKLRDIEEQIKNINVMSKRSISKIIKK